MTHLMQLSCVCYRYPCLPGQSSRGEALTDISFCAGRGERLALVGANGAGKSTLLWLLNGTYRPTSGSVTFGGARVDYSHAGLLALRRHVVLVTQDPDDQLFAGTLREDVSFGPLNLGLSAAETARRVDEALAQMELTALGHLPPHQLSHGQRKRAAIAGALAMHPRLLVLDEPTAGLDPRSVEGLLRLLRSLERQGTTILLSTHDLEFADAWASRVLVMQDGSLKADGPTAGILGDESLMRQTGLRVPFGRLQCLSEDLDPEWPQATEAKL